MDGTQPANWKIVADNYLEGYHVPIAHPGLMRLLDYKRYDVEVRDGWVWFEAPLRDKPSGNLMERAYQRLVRRCPGWARDRRVWRYVLIYPNTTIDLYPDQVVTWQIDPDGPLRARDDGASLPPPARRRCARALAQRAQPPAQHARRQRGLRPRRERPGRHRDARLEPGPLSRPRGGDRLVRGPRSGRTSE